MTKYLLVIISICFFLTGGCVSSEAKRPEEGPSRLERLRGGMSMEEAINLLGPPTTVTTIQEAPRSEKYYNLTYTDTLIKPGVVELIFDPDLIEIRRDGKLYRDLGR